MMKNAFVYVLFQQLIVFLSFSQNIGIGTDFPDNQSILDIRSTSAGIFIPRMTTLQRDSIGVINGQDNGLIIYNNSTDLFNYWDGLQWVEFPANDDDWTRGPGTLYPSNINDNVGIGTSNPQARLQVDNGRVIFTSTNDATATPGSGVLEIGGGLRIDNNEIITDMNSKLYLQSDNIGDLEVDGGTFFLDGSMNRVGINTTAPRARLDIRNIGNIDSLLALPGGRTLIWDANNNSDRYGFNVGDNSPDALYFLSEEGSHNQAMAIVFADGDNDPNEVIFGISTKDPGQPWDSKFIIDQNGKIGIGTNTPSYILQLATDSAAKPGNGQWTVPSDRTLKKDIEPYEEGLQKILKLNPIWFTYNGKFGFPESRYVGTIADELEVVFPYMVESQEVNDEFGNSEVVSFVNYSALNFALVNAVKDLSKVLDEQSEEIEMLKHQIQSINVSLKQIND